MNEETLREIICERFLAGDRSFPLERTTNLIEEGICDSLALVQIAIEIEGRSPGISIPDQEITRENFQSIAAILSFLETLRS